VSGPAIRSLRTRLLRLHLLRRHLLSGLLVASALLSAPETAVAADRPVIGPGKERAALALVAPLKDEGPVVDGVVLAGLRIEQHRLVVILATTTEPKKVAEIRLEPLSADRRAETGRDFAVRIPADLNTPLARAAKVVADAVATNDKGGFFGVSAPSAMTPTGAAGGPGKPSQPHPDARDRVPLALEDPDFELMDAWSSRLAVVLWLLAGLALVALVVGACGQLVFGPRRLRRTATGLLLAVVFGLAMSHRAGGQLLPLHANNHAYEDIVAALGGPDSGPDTQRHVAGYGASWLVAQRGLTAVFGAHHDGLRAQAAWWGAGAITVAVAAAVTAGGSLWLAALVGIGAAGLPVAALVGQSESTLVIAQFLIALSLLFAAVMAGGSRRRRMVGAVGTVAALALLAGGHVVGPILAGGTALLCWMLSVGSLADDSERALHPEAIGWLAILGAPAALGLGLRLATSGAEVGARLEASGTWLPVPGNPFAFSLWLMDPASSALVGLAIVGIAAVWLIDDARGVKARRLLAGASLAGVLGVGAAGLLVCACLTDGLRYQATLVGPLVVLAALGGRAVMGGGAARRFAAAVVLLALIGPLLLGDGQAAIAQDEAGGVDAQTRGYALLRRQLAGLRGPVWLVDAGRTSERGAVLRVAEGRLDEHGPVVRRLRIESMRAMCEADLPLPGPAYAFVDPACAIGRGDKAVAPPCQELRRLIRRGAIGSYGAVKTARLELREKGLRGEFLAYGEGNVSWRFGPAGCPEKPAKQVPR